MNELDSLVEQAKQLFSACASPAELENAKAQYFGKAGHLTTLMKALSSLDIDAKKAQGALINAAKQAIEQALHDCRQKLADAELQAQLKAETFDVSLPSHAMAQGGLHPVSLRRHLLCRGRLFAANAHQSHADSPCHGACSKIPKSVGCGAIHARNSCHRARSYLPR